MESHVLFNSNLNTETFRRTSALRWLGKPGTTTEPMRLQQAWQGDKGTVRWEDVPTEIEPTDS